MSVYYRSGRRYSDSYEVISFKLNHDGNQVVRIAASRP